MVAQVDPSFSKISRAEQIIALIRRSTDLEVRLASYQEASKIEERLNKREAVSGCKSTTARLFVHRVISTIKAGRRYV